MKTPRNPKTMRGNKLLITITIDPDQVAAIDEIADARRTSRAALFREAIDLYLTKKREEDKVAA